MSVIRQVNDRLKLSKKLLNSFSIIAIVSILLTAVLSTVAFWFVFTNREETDLKEYADTVTKAYDSLNFDDITRSYSTKSIRVTLIAPDGSVLADSSDKNVTDAVKNQSDRPEVQEALKNGVGSSYRMSVTHNSSTYYYAVRAGNGNIIRLSKTLGSIAEIFIIIIPAVIVIMIGVFIVCMIVSKRSMRKMIKPIEKMSKNLDDTPYEELVPLAETISSQQKQIKKQIQRLQIEKDKIATLIDNMSEGFILIDLDKNILMSNHAASDLLASGDDASLQKNLLAYSRNDVVNDCVDSAIGGESKSGDSTFKGRALQIIANPVYSGDKQNGVICLIIDISAKKKAEKMRREFTANVTHELKTPLTSISGYAEIIASGLAKSDDIQGFANKIHKESGRLLALISDIMELSQLDESLSDESFAPVDLMSVANEVVEDLRSNAKKHSVTISVEAVTAVINGDKNQIYELIYNLCDNAIRYNKVNGKVSIIVTDDNDHPCVKVADTGIGIPEKHHKRIFERFYRVDKSRSKETGGTGLGLAIVKHIAERHGGRVTLESDESGTTFIVEF